MIHLDRCHYTLSQSLIWSLVQFFVECTVSFRKAKKWLTRFFDNFLQLIPSLYGTDFKNFSTETDHSPHMLIHPMSVFTKFTPPSLWSLHRWLLDDTGVNPTVDTHTTLHPFEPVLGLPDWLSNHYPTLSFFYYIFTEDRRKTVFIDPLNTR